MSKPLFSLTLLKWIIRISILTFAVMTVWLWVDPDTLAPIGGKVALVDKYGGMDRLLGWQRIAGFSVDALPAALIIAALARLHTLLTGIEAGRWFDETTELSCRMIGKLMLFYVLAAWMHDTLMVLVLTATNEPGHRELQIGISSNQLLGLMPALMAFVIAEMVRHARAQRDELNQII